MANTSAIIIRQCSAHLGVRCFWEVQTATREGRACTGRRERSTSRLCCGGVEPRRGAEPFDCSRSFSYYAEWYT